MSRTTTPPLFDRFASLVADFGSPFYVDERNRDVWNEASALGFQFLLWTGIALSGVMFWVGGRPVAPYGLALLVIVVAASYLVLIHSKRLGVEATPGRRDLPRLLVFGGLYAVVGMGAVRAFSTGPELTTGLVVGSVLGVAAVIVGAARTRRRDRAVG